MGVKAKTRIKEVIIENYMSHEYSRVKLEPGLNIITGPNGAGKSSILLAISVAMGQTYTERAKRLSDLIRRGKDYAIVSIVLDNTPKSGKRPFPYKQDEIVISRILKKTGDYPFQINYSYATKMEVERLLRRANINPENLLLIMHQGMVEMFSFVDPIEKLRMFEEALGIKEYRDRILDSRRRLSRIVSEEAEVRGYLKDIRSTLEEWEKKYKRYLEKLELENRIRALYREYAWAKYFSLKEEYENLYLRKASLLEDLRNEDINLARIKEEIVTLNRKFEECIENLRGVINALSEGNFREEPTGLKAKANELLHVVYLLKNKYGDVRSAEAISQLKIEALKKEIRTVESKLRELNNALKEVEIEALKHGEPLKSNRSLQDIQVDIKAVKEKLESYRDVDESVKDTYSYYKRLFDEVEERINKILADKSAAEEELSKRILLWQRELQKYVEAVSKEYNRILSRINGFGYVKVTNISDIDNSGLEVYVGFGKSEPYPMDSYAQSGGERTLAVVSFLLALQQFIESPFRAVDEFDVHLDPRMREVILSYLVELMKDREDQYVIITPGYLPKNLTNVNIIVVQKIEGISRVAQLPTQRALEVP